MVMMIYKNVHSQVVTKGYGDSQGNVLSGDDNNDVNFQDCIDLCIHDATTYYGDIMSNNCYHRGRSIGMMEVIDSLNMHECTRTMLFLCDHTNAQS